MRAVQAHPEWEEFAWPGLARSRAARGDFAAAWTLVKEHAQPPPLPASVRATAIPELQKQLYENPADPAAGYALYRAQMLAGKPADALATARHFTARSDAPAYFYYLEAQSWAAQENWEHAWRSWESYRSTGERR